MTRQRGADLLARSLQAAGVRRVFSLSGNHIMVLHDALLDVGIELVHTRHEAAAVHMADAWARLNGEVGVALVTGGPGHANAVSALYTAAMAEAPVLLLSGHAPLAQLGRGAFQDMRQAEMAAPVCKASRTVLRAEALGDELAAAWRCAAGGRPGPVHLSLPVDVLEPTPVALAAPPAPAFHAAPERLADADARSLIDWLRAANRPLVLTGPQSLTPSGRRRMAEAQAALGVPVIGMESPRGVADPSLGAFADVLAQADAVLLLGKRLDFTLGFGAAPALAAACRFAAIDADPAELQRTRAAVGDRLDAGVVADAADALRTLAQAASGRQRSGWMDEVLDAVAWRPPAWTQAAAAAGRLHPVQACRPLQALLDEHAQAVLVSDGGEFGQWAQACLDAPWRVVNGVAGAIGAALPFAAAARLAAPGAPVIAFSGDGSIGFHIAEVDTALRHGLPFVMVVGNDARWNAEHQIQLRAYGESRAHGCGLLPTRYDQVFRAFGGRGELVTDADQLVPAARRALASALPACLNVMIEGLAAPRLSRR